MAQLFSTTIHFENPTRAGKSIRQYKLSLTGTWKVICFFSRSRLVSKRGNIQHGVTSVGTGDMYDRNIYTRVLTREKKPDTPQNFKYPELGSLDSSSSFGRGTMKILNSKKVLTPSKGSNESPVPSFTLQHTEHRVSFKATVQLH
jgi:hypothetical protein